MNLQFQNVAEELLTKYNSASNRIIVDFPSFLDFSSAAVDLVISRSSDMAAKVPPEKAFPLAWLPSLFQLLLDTKKQQPIYFVNKNHVMICTATQYLWYYVSKVVLTFDYMQIDWHGIQFVRPTLVQATIGGFD